MATTAKDKFEAAVTVIQSLPKDGKNRWFWCEECLTEILNVSETKLLYWSSSTLSILSQDKLVVYLGGVSWPFTTHCFRLSTKADLLPLTWLWRNVVISCSYSTSTMFLMKSSLWQHLNAIEKSVMSSPHHPFCTHKIHTAVLDTAHGLVPPRGGHSRSKSIGVHRSKFKMGPNKIWIKW